MPMEKSKIAEKVTVIYGKIENTAVDSYHKIEQTVVGCYTKIEDAFVQRYLLKESETLAQAKERLKQETG